MADWGAARVTPERGVKGLLFGKMFSVFGDLLDMSIQHAGVQIKVSNGQRVPFSKRKDTETVTITTNPNTYINRPSGNDMRFREANQDQMVLLSGGNLGIGTSTPSAKVQISGSANSVLLNVKSPISGDIVS